MWILIALMTFLTLSCERERETVSSYSVDPKELAGIKGCPYCHDMRRQLLGPPFYEISKRYSKEDEEELIRSLLRGSSGKWGDNAMPPQKVTEEEARILIRWILSLKERGS